MQQLAEENINRQSIVRAFDTILNFLVQPETVEFSEGLNGVVNNTLGLLPQLKYPALDGKLEWTGETLKFTPNDNRAATFDRGVDMNYLAQFHFHAPSEHRIDGESWPLELHLVHLTATNSIAVVGTMIKIGQKTSPFMEELLVIILHNL